MINDYEATKPITTDASFDSTTISNDDVISTLNGLIETCKDGQNGFKEAAEGVERSDLKSLFYEFSQQRSQFAGELQSLVQSLGGDPENWGSVAAAIHRGWINIKSAVTGKDEGAILNECERGEDSAKNAYKKASRRSTAGEHHGDRADPVCCRSGQRMIGSGLYAMQRTTKRLTSRNQHQQATKNHSYLGLLNEKRLANREPLFPAP